MSIKIDLHMHSIASDGTWTVDELLREIQKNKIDIFSVTDHDTIESSEKIKNKKLPDGCTFIPGVEISSTYKDREYHLTVYNYENSEELSSFIKNNNDMRLEYNYKFIDLMSKVYPEVSLDDYFNNYEEDPSKGGWKALNYFIDNDIFKDIGEYFHKLKNTGLKLIFKSPEEVVEISKKCKGKIFLAHPSYYYREGCMPEEELNYWKDIGIDGIECFTPYAMKKFQEKYYFNYARKNNLMISGGSDCHGEYLGRNLGVPAVYLDQLDIDQLIDLENFKKHFKRGI